MNKRIKIMFTFVFAYLCCNLIFSNNVMAQQISVNNRQTKIKTTLIGNELYVSLKDFCNVLKNVTYEQESDYIDVHVQTNEDKISEVISKVSPCVVGIIGTLKEDEESTYEDRYLDKIAHGTGIVIKEDGYILTNAHVVKDLDKIVVVFSDGNGYEAKLKCIDEDADLALVKIQKTGLQTAKFGKKEDIIVGKTVISIGTPVSFSLQNSASVGIISGVDRNINSFYRLIQTDAAVNPGNSGGPLVNLNGEIIGINSVKFTGTGVERMGFAIPINIVNYVLEHFDKYGYVNRPNVGVEFEEDWAARVGLPSNNGLKITSIDKTQSKSKYELQEGDILIDINGSKVNSIVEFNEEMIRYNPNDKVTIKIKRNGIIQSLNILLKK